VSEAGSIGKVEVDSIRTAYDQHAFIFWLVLAGIVVLMALWLMAVQSRARRAEARMEELLRGVSGDNVARMLTEYLGTVRSTAQTVERVNEEHVRMAQVMPTVVRHVGLVRFSPFHDTGGDQSFALALLDGRGDGVVLTGLHSRNDSRLYAKPIERGDSTYSLTPEERQAMQNALEGDRVAARG
jgi:Protein of unknown function (DUF4446)